MKIRALFVTRIYERDFPELVDAWDEYTIDENPEGFEEARKKAADDDGVHAYAEVVIEVNERAVMNELYPDPVVLPGKIVAG